MPDSADQARQLAALFLEMSQAVDSFLNRNFDRLTPADRQALEQWIQTLEDIHDRFTAAAIQATLDAIRQDLDTITHVTGEAQTSLRHLNSVAEVVKLVSAAAELAEDIFIADYGAIPQAIKDIVQAIPKKADENPSGGDQSGA